MTRIEPVAGDSGDETLARVFASFTREGRRPIALYRTLGRVPALLERYSALARWLRYDSALPRDLRELLILRGALLIGSDYEWSHHLPMARAAGVPEEKITALASWTGATVFDARERAALQCVDRVHAVEVDEATHDELRQHFSEEQVVELVFLCAFYELVGRVVDGLGVEVEDDYRGYLAQTPRPQVD